VRIKEDAMAQPTPPGRNPATWVAVTILLLIAVAGTLIVPIYARSAPKLGAFPFFYWYQLIWVPVVAILAWISYLLLRTRPGQRARANAGSSEGVAK
jgi:branched-subunit amino acid ABC-type transport system permease component